MYATTCDIDEIPSMQCGIRVTELEFLIPVEGLPQAWADAKDADWPFLIFTSVYPDATGISVLLF